MAQGSLPGIRSKHPRGRHREHVRPLDRREAGPAAVATGSHVDAIPHAGKYDGVVGVLGGLEAIRALQRAGFAPERSIELIIFTSEEPTRFGIGCLGSRLMSGVLGPDAAAALHDAEGNTLDVLRHKRGFCRGAQ